MSERGECRNGSVRKNGDWISNHSGMEKRNIGYRMGERGTLGRGWKGTVRKGRWDKGVGKREKGWKGSVRKSKMG